MRTVLWIGASVVVVAATTAAYALRDGAQSAVASPVDSAPAALLAPETTTEFAGAMKAITAEIERPGATPVPASLGALPEPLAAELRSELATAVGSNFEPSAEQLAQVQELLQRDHPEELAALVKGALGGLLPLRDGGL